METCTFSDLDLLSTTQILDQLPASNSFMSNQGNQSSYHGNLTDLSIQSCSSSRTPSSGSESDFTSPTYTGNMEFFETDFLTDNQMLKDHNNNNTDKPSLVKVLASDNYGLNRKLNGTNGVQNSLSSLVLDSHDAGDISQTLRKGDLMFADEDSLLPNCEGDNIALDRFIIRGDANSVGETNYTSPESRVVNPQEVLDFPRPRQSDNSHINTRVAQRTGPVAPVRTSLHVPMKAKQSAPLRYDAQGNKIKSKRGRKPGQGR